MKKIGLVMALLVSFIIFPSSVKAATGTSVNYQTHVQTFGWQGVKSNGQVAGTSGQAKRLEAIKISLSNTEYSGNIEYRTHIQKLGWESSFRKNGQLSGTSGRALRLEAIQIKLTGEIANYYDVYYRVHAQTYGWQGWAKNGASAGTAGFAFRLEAIQIVLISKGSAAPGDTADSFRDGNNKYVDARGNGLIKGSSQRIYHLPGSEYYNRTTKPIKMFKTEAEAIKSGFRPAK